MRKALNVRVALAIVLAVGGLAFLATRLVRERPPERIEGAIVPSDDVLRELVEIEEHGRFRASDSWGDYASVRADFRRQLRESVGSRAAPGVARVPRADQMLHTVADRAALYLAPSFEGYAGMVKSATGDRPSAVDFFGRSLGPGEWEEVAASSTPVAVSPDDAELVFLYRDGRPSDSIRGSGMAFLAVGDPGIYSGINHRDPRTTVVELRMPAIMLDQEGNRFYGFIGFAAAHDRSTGRWVPFQTRIIDPSGGAHALVTPWF